MTIPVAPQRFLANNRNLLRDAVLVASSVLPVTNKVLPIPTARKGTAQVTLTGEYTGAEQADIDIEIVDTDVDVSRISAPTFAGAGTGTLTDIVASGSPQVYTVELSNAGAPETTAEIALEGVKIKSAVAGAAGNLIRLTVDQSPLVFAASSYSLLADLTAGQGSAAAPMIGAGFDWDSAVLDANGLIPAGAHRIAFGDDRSSVYLSFKEFVVGQWQYRLVPAVTRTVPRGTAIYFVTEGRDVTVSNGTSTETYNDIETAYDLLIALRTLSTLVVVDGIVANDRSPTGQASRELTLRTDAHAEVSIGTGSPYATGFVDATVTGDAPTELITARCYANRPSDHPLAGLGRERWALNGSLSGDLGTIVTGVPYVQPTDRLGQPGHFALTVPIKLPPGFGTPKGRFTEAAGSPTYASRTGAEIEPPICVVAMALGPDAVDETITLRYTRRPTGDCNCTDLPVPDLANSCLGNLSEGGTDVSDLSDVNRERLIDIYEWYRTTVRANSGTLDTVPAEQGFLSQPGAVTNFDPEPLRLLVRDFEAALTAINDLPGTDDSPSLKRDGESAWDDAVAELKADVAAAAGVAQTETFPAFEDLDAGMAVGIFTDNAGVRKVRKAATGLTRYGFVLVDVAEGDDATVYYGGIVGVPATLTPGRDQAMSAVAPGAWMEADSGGNYTPATNVINGGFPLFGRAISDHEIIIEQLRWWSVRSLLTDRYQASIDWVYISAGISPTLGKADATLASGDGCWRDFGGSAWWVVTGSVNGGYAPAFSNKPYWACRDNGSGKFFSTHEFALQLNIKCEGDLKDGDTVTLVIANASWGATYQVGDALLLPIVAAGPLYLTGGRNGSPTQTWNVNGSVDGPFAAYLFDPTAPVPYADGGLAFTMTEGGIPYARGDRYRFASEGGHYRWRKNGGAWHEDSPLPAIPLSPVLITDGLSAEFTTGAAASFVAGDAFRFRALQPWAVSNMQSPKSVNRAWKWDTQSPPDATLDATFDAVKQLDMVALLCTLPDGATVTLDGGELAPDEWSEELTYSDGQVWKAIDRQAKYVRITFTNAGGGSLRYAWLGAPVSTPLTADWNPVRAYSMGRASAGLLQGGRYLGKGDGGQVSWSESAMVEADRTALVAMLDYVKQRDDEPIIFIPQVTRIDEPFVYGLIDSDGVEFRNVRGNQQNASVERRYSANIPIAGVWWQ